MKIYVQSAGVSQQQDYIWQQITQTDQKRVDEPILVKDFKGLLETEAPSILIGRKNDQLILLVTGMKSSKRKDYRNRTIRNSIALITKDDGDNEQKIRGIAVLALEGKLENQIDSAIKEGGEWGFEVDYQKIDNIIIKAFSQTSNSSVTKAVMTGKNTENNRKIIADELQKNCLPDKNNYSEALVVVTGIKTEDALKQAGVWRGLSNLVEKEKLAPYQPTNLPQIISRLIEGTAQAKFVGILIISIAVIGLIILYLWSQNPSNSTTVLSSISPGGNYIASANLDGQLLVQNTQDGINNIIENSAPIKSIALSRNGRYVVTGNDTGKVQLWDVNSKKKLETTNDNKLKHEKAVLSVAIKASDNKITIVSGGADGKVLLWTGEVNNGKFIPSIEELPK